MGKTKKSNRKPEYFLDKRSNWDEIGLENAKMVAEKAELHLTHASQISDSIISKARAMLALLIVVIPAIITYYMSPTDSVEGAPPIQTAAFIVIVIGLSISAALCIWIQWPTKNYWTGIKPSDWEPGDFDKKGIQIYVAQAKEYERRINENLKVNFRIAILFNIAVVVPLALVILGTLLHFALE